MGLLAAGINLVERGWIPDSWVRAGIRRLCRRRLQQCHQDASSGNESDFLDSMFTGPVAPVPEKANQQHYEVPAEFFQLVLGPSAKYSSCFFKDTETSLEQAELDALGVTCQRAELRDGQHVLELGCGWGSLSLYMASRYPNSKFTAVSNSTSQRKHIESIAEGFRLNNLRVVTADMNEFSTSERFDRVVSVEMFEHMRNYKELLARVSSWLRPGGKLFVHIFTHREFCYPFETGGDANWMGKYFFTGGIMPSQNVFRRFGEDLVVENQFRWNGIHYQRTLEAWLSNMDAKREQVLELFKNVYGVENSIAWFNRWRVFFMACSELFGFNDGNEWFVSHYLLTPTGDAEVSESQSLDTVHA